MRPTWVLLVAIVILASSSYAEALSIVSAEATLDWAHVTITTTGTLSLTSINEIPAPPGFVIGPFLSTGTTPTTPSGAATAVASAGNGAFALAGALTTADGGLPNVGQAAATSLHFLAFVASGSGSLVVAVPYHLELSIIESGDRDITGAVASVDLINGIDLSSPNARSDVEISLSGAGTLSRDGVLTASNLVLDPFLDQTHPFDDVQRVVVGARVLASAALPEASSMLLVTVGVVGLCLLALFRPIAG
jgi:hypothetical protein